ncbi:MAG: CDP-diacylglycerol--serine O-phosphatidyltransferase, partial [Shewanella sp.]
CWQAHFEAEQAHILEHTQRLYHYSQVDTLQNYPAPVKKIMTRIRRLKADFLLRRIL